MRPTGNIHPNSGRLSLDDRRETGGIECFEGIDARMGIGIGCN